MAHCDHTGKVAHGHPEAAELVALRARACGENMHAYRCDACGRYHVGHVPGGARHLQKREMREARRELVRTRDQRNGNRNLTRHRLRRQAWLKLQFEQSRGFDDE